MEDKDRQGILKGAVDCPEIFCDCAAEYDGHVKHCNFHSRSEEVLIALKLLKESVGLYCPRDKNGLIPLKLRKAYNIATEAVHVAESKSTGE